MGQDGPGRDGVRAEGAEHGHSRHNGAEGGAAGLTGPTPGEGRPGSAGRNGTARDRALERIRAAGLDGFAAANLLAYLAEQRQATGYVPDDRTLLVERFHDDLAGRVGALLPGAIPDDGALAAAVWDLVWAGRITGDTLAPLRATLGTGRPAHRRAPTRGRRAVLPTRSGPPTVGGRWWPLPAPSGDATKRVHAQAEILLERHGVLTRGAVAAERLPGGFAAVYQVLRAFEESGRCRRGYFVESLGGAQFALPGAVDRMRATSAAPGTGAPVSDPWNIREPAAGASDPWAREPAAGVRRAVVLAATDPANPYGAALPWPVHPGEGSHRPGRKAGSLVVLVDGHLMLYAELGGKTLLSFSTGDGLRTAVGALALAVRDGALGKLTVERANGTAINDPPLAAALESAGFHPTPKGLRLRA